METDFGIKFLSLGVAVAVLGIVLAWASTAPPTAAQGGPEVVQSAMPLIGNDARQSGLMIQNQSLEHDTEVEFRAYTSSRGLVDTARLEIPAAATGGIWMPAMQRELTLYSGLVVGSMPVAAIVRTDVPTSGGASLYSQPRVGRHLVSPLFAWNYHGQRSALHVQNVSISSVASVAATLTTFDGTEEVAQFSILPGTAIDARHLFIESGSDRTILGALEITSTEPVAAVNSTTIHDRAVYAFEGIPADRARSRLYTPLFRAAQAVFGSRFDTGISIFNPTDELATVSIEYRGAGGSCDGDTIRGRPVEIQPRRSAVIYQGDLAAEGLPSDCFGSAVIESNGPEIMAMVNDSFAEGATAASFSAFIEDDGARTLGLPLWRNNHVGYSTGIAVMNLGAARATVTLELRDGQGRVISCGSGCAREAGVGETIVFWPPSLSVPAETFGSAVIRSTERVVAIVNDVPELRPHSADMATYSAIPLGDSVVP